MLPLGVPPSVEWHREEPCTFLRVHPIPLPVLLHGAMIASLPPTIDTGRILGHGTLRQVTCHPQAVYLHKYDYMSTTQHEKMSRPLLDLFTNKNHDDARKNVIASALPVAPHLCVDIELQRREVHIAVQRMSSHEELAV